MNQMQLQPWETELARKYRQLIELYEQATVSAGGLPEMFATGREADDALRQLHRVFERAAQFEKEVRPIRESWASLRKPPSPALAQILKHAEQIIRSLLDQISLAEQAAQRTRQTLAPQLAEESQRGRMVSAYRSAQQH